MWYMQNTQCRVLGAVCAFLTCLWDLRETGGWRLEEPLLLSRALSCQLSQTLSPENPGAWAPPPQTLPNEKGSPGSTPFPLCVRKPLPRQRAGVLGLMFYVSLPQGSPWFTARLSNVLKTFVAYILSMSLIISCGTINLVPNTPSWVEPEVLCFLATRHFRVLAYMHQPVIRTFRNHCLLSNIYIKNPNRTSMTFYFL